MEKAAVTAEQLGRVNLAALLRKEIVGYRNPMARVTAGLVYSEICDVVVENPELTFWQVIDFVRRDYGFSRQEFLKRFRRAKAVFDQEKRDAQEQARARARFLATLAQVECHPPGHCEAKRLLIAQAGGTTKESLR